MSLETFKTHVLPVKHKLYRFALRLLGSEDEAKDVVQEVMIKMWDKRQDIGQLKNTEAWCMRITKNMSVDRLRSKRVQVTENIDNHYELKQAERGNPYQSTEANDTMKSISKFIASLPAKQQQVMQLRDIEGYSYKEIGDILEIDINQVKVNLFRARKAVKENLLNINAYGL